MIYLPPEAQAAAGVPAAQVLQCGFSGFGHTVRREHFAQAKLVRRQLFVTGNTGKTKYTEYTRILSAAIKSPSSTGTGGVL